CRTGPKRAGASVPASGRSRGPRCGPDARGPGYRRGPGRRSRPVRRPGGRRRRRGAHRGPARGGAPPSGTLVIRLGLARLAGVLLWPAPLLLARARWTRSEPRAALVLWQSLGLAAGLALIGAAVAAAVAPLGGGLFQGLSAVLRGGLDQLTPVHAVLLA